MVSLTDSLVSASSRILTLKKRPDLSARRQRYLGKNYWIVKDPVGLKYYRFQEEEYAILNMLDGTVSLDDIKQQFEAEFPPQKIKLEELQSFLGQLHQSGLILTSVNGQGRQLFKRSKERRRRELLQASTNILAIKFKGVDPERFFNWLYPKVSWLFHPITVTFCVLLMLSALSLIMVQFDVFRSRLPGFYQFFTPTNGLLLAAVLGCTKILHEFGHGLTCKHFGGECHELGVMILVLTPCLFCNVSDSWMLPNKWKRAAIGFAGIYVEVLLAAIATFIWWFTNPGLLNNICLNIMFISSVSTILFNANPLLRYDGYYVLSDIMEIPNMRQKATSITSRKMGEWFLGLEYPDDPFLPQKNQLFFTIFTIASVIYRWVVMCSIMFFLWRLLDYYGLQIIAKFMIIMSLWGLVGMPLWKLGKFFYIPGRLDKVKKSHFIPSIIGLVLLACFLLFVPLPYRVFVPLELRLSNPNVISVTIDGTLKSVNVKPGQKVKKGDVIATLENIDKDMQLDNLKFKMASLETRLSNLRDQSVTNAAAYKEIPAVQESLNAVKKQYQDMSRYKTGLILRAGIDGEVVPTDYKTKRAEVMGILPDWSGSLFEPTAIGAYMNPKEVKEFCYVGDLDKLEALLVISLSERDFVEVGQKVVINLNELPFKKIEGKIESISRDPIEFAPKRLSNKSGGEIATETDQATGLEKPQEKCYEARVLVDNSERLMRPGLTGQAKIYVTPQTCGQRLWRLIMEVFNFKL
ncbi:MAG: biotin/lipoyl-binding protein [Thermoguttaceae bacterium]|nr:biotin/lipoyl-binding protein [Thermoguttaceae bacterium]